MTTLTNIQQIEKQIADLFTQIESKQHEIANFEYSCSDSQFDDFLDDCYSGIEIMGMAYNVSYALKEIDPTAYRCAKADYEANFELEDCEEYRDMLDKLEDLESELEDLESED